jgi:hypothetical protein
MVSTDIVVETHRNKRKAMHVFEMERMIYLPEGHPITQRPSTRACVERLPNLARSSSLISPPWAGPMAIVRWAMLMVALLRDAAAVAARRKVEDSMVEDLLRRVWEGEVKQGGWRRPECGQEASVNPRALLTFCGIFAGIWRHADVTQKDSWSQFFPHGVPDVPFKNEPTSKFHIRTQCLQ